MRQVSKTSASVLSILIDGLNEDTRSKKIDNRPGVFMAVNVEYLHETSQGKYYSICHYYEQNGDLMRDPEIVYLMTMKDNEPEFFPVSYRQDGLGIDREYCQYDDDGKIIGIATALQADSAVFSTLWMRNIKQQQKL
jgi:hypothetical protein